MITTNEYNTQKISLGSLQNKKSREGIEYQNIPILYDGKKQLFICAEDLTWKKMFLLIALPITLTLSAWKLMLITENYLKISRKNFKV